MTLNQLAALILFFSFTPRCTHTCAWRLRGNKLGPTKTGGCHRWRTNTIVLRGGHVVDEFTDIATTIYIIYAAARSHVSQRENTYAVLQQPRAKVILLTLLVLVSFSFGYLFIFFRGKGKMNTNNNAQWKRVRRNGK